MITYISGELSLDQILQSRARYRRFAQFFNNFSSGISDGITAVESQALELEYDDLFKGTNASVYVPLWASVSTGGDETLLLDSITLEIVSFYRHWGYSKPAVDGNPPDFIGNQFEFLCYLYTDALRADLNGDSAKAVLEAADVFSERYTRASARAAAEAIARQATFALFKQMAAELLQYANDESNLPFAAETELAELYENEVYRNGRGAAIEISEKRLINTAGRNNCGGKCVIRVEEQCGCLLGIAADCDIPGNPAVKPCARGRAYLHTFMRSDRLRYPMRRIGARGEGKFKRISWEEAADITASEWARIRDKFGVASRYVQYSSGVNAVVRPDALVRRLLNLDGGFLGYYNTYSSACATFIAPYIYGDTCCRNSPQDILNTKLLILWGHNPVETIFGSDSNYYIAEAKRRGIPIIAIDPRVSDSVKAFASEWVGIRPSTDGALADGMAYVIYTENLHDRDFLNQFCVGFDEEHLPDGVPSNLSYRTYLLGEIDGIPKTPEWASAITGVPADKIAELARRYATTKPACLMPGLGPQRTGNGEQTTRSLALLACMTGNIGIPGGGSAAGGFAKGPYAPGFPSLSAAYPGSIPSFLWTKAVEHAREMTPRDDGVTGVSKLDVNIKMIVNFAGNTLVNQHSDVNETTRILKDESACEFILCSDVFMTPSAKFADILLPATSVFEDENISLPWGAATYMTYHNRAVEPLFECRFEYDFVRAVARRLGLEKAWSAGCDSHVDWLKTLFEGLREKRGELPDFETFRRDGVFNSTDNTSYIAYEEQIRDLEKHPFATPSGKIEIFSGRIYELNRPDEIPAIPRYVPCPEGPQDPLTLKYPLQLIGWHTKRRAHSTHDNNKVLEKLDPQRLWINPKDARERGIESGDRAEVYNDRGRLLIPVYITERIIKGVVALSQGAWYLPDETGTDTRGSINVLTSQRPTPLARGNAQHTNLVEVARNSQ